MATIQALLFGRELRSPVPIGVQRAGAIVGGGLVLLAATSLLLAPPVAAQPPVAEEGAQPPAAEEAVLGAASSEPLEAPAATETVCDDGEDQDGDGMIDCADADCFEVAVCAAGGREERNDERCSDWVDNDGDAAVDCDDQDCQGPGITVCEGSLPSEGHGAATGGGEDELPELSGDMTVEDLIGQHGDADGERNDFLCADGIDNDGDGRTDCADFGCRFDPQVSVCAGRPSFRFSVVAGVGAQLDVQELMDDTGLYLPADIRFTRLQLRVLGPIPLVENSFFLLSLRMERSPRLTFAHFQIPLGDTGHYIAVNSGSGGLSSGLIISTSKQPLLDPAYYLFNAFEQGNGAALEVGGPVFGSSLLRYRAFVAGGSGYFNGNVGGRFFRSDTQNFTYSVGAQLAVNLIGHFDRFDSPMLFTPGSLTLATLIGAKYDQRPRERYPAANMLGVFMYRSFLVRAEIYTKREIDFGAWQTAWNLQTSILLLPRRLLLAADVGQFVAGDFEPPDGFDADLRRPLDELQWRVAMHLYWYRNIGLLSLLYAERHIEENVDRPTDRTVERSLRLEAQFRF
ncbi:MAG: hypothetical protein OEY14_00700 [Myxococcales bacterium]|nr:hypothetical protein [Myxococcales bacterium]